MKKNINYKYIEAVWISMEIGSTTELKVKTEKCDKTSVILSKHNGWTRVSIYDKEIQKQEFIINHYDSLNEEELSSNKQSLEIINSIL